MVDCGTQVRLDAYYDGELSPAERADVEAHLRDCPSCAAELAAIRGMSAAFADAAPPGPSHEQLLQLAASVRAEPSDALMLLRLFRGTAVAAAVLLASTLATARYLSQRTEAAANEEMVLDHVATGSPLVAFAADPAQWIVDDLADGHEER
jgi:anti-sigma factor RsiW